MKYWNTKSMHAVLVLVLYIWQGCGRYSLYLFMLQLAIYMQHGRAVS